MTDVTYPIRREYKTPWGWRVEIDYGPKRGVTKGEIILPTPCPEERERNHAAMNDVLARYGYEVKDFGRSWQELWEADPSPIVD